MDLTCEQYEAMPNEWEGWEFVPEDRLALNVERPRDI